jgi:hypothetical protein
MRGTRRVDTPSKAKLAGKDDHGVPAERDPVSVERAPELALARAHLTRG